MKLFTSWLVLSLIQTVAALPWIITLDRRVWFALRRPLVAGLILGGNVLVAVIAAFGIEGYPENLARWSHGYAAALHLQLAADFFIVVFVFLLLVWPKGGAVALAAFREAIRQPMFLLLVLPTIFFVMPIVPVLPYFTLGEDLKMVKEIGYDILTLLGGVFVVICASTSISDEIEGRTAITLMSKPVSRRQFLIGKFAGILTAGVVLVVLLGWFMVWMFIFAEWFQPKLAGAEKTPDPTWVVDFSASVAAEAPVYHIVRGICLWVDEAGIILPGLVIVSCQVMVLLAISVALATRLHYTLNFIVCAAFYFLGHLAPVLTAVSEQKVQLVRFMAGVFDVILPGLEHFDMSGAVVRDAPLPRLEFAWYAFHVALYATTYSVIALLFGLILFEDKDLA